MPPYLSTGRMVIPPAGQLLRRLDDYSSGWKTISPRLIGPTILTLIPPDKKESNKYEVIAVLIDWFIGWLHASFKGITDVLHIFFDQSSK